MQAPVRATSGTVRGRRREAGVQGVYALPDGRAVTVRPVSSADRERLGRMLSRLSPRTIYERFHAPYPRVPGWALAGMVEADHHDTEALVAVVGGEFVGHAMYVRARNGREAELAVVVEDRWQSRGIGRLLLTELAAEAGSRGVEILTGSVLGENHRMLGVMATVFPEMRYEIRGGTYQVRAHLRPLPREGTGERVA
jgi:GNAT superfamily N-acetyltransferase